MIRVRLTPRRLALAALLGACAAAPLWGPPLLRHVDAFDVERVEVAGAHLLAPHEVLAASGIRLGESVWSDPEPWLRALRTHPVIRDASVERVLPRTLRIRVQERQPVALVEQGTLRAAAAEGDLLPLDPTRAPLDLPLIRVAGGIGDGATVEHPEARFLLAEAGRLGQLDPALVARLSELRRDATGDLVAVLITPAAELRLPPGADAQRLRQLRAVLHDLENRSSDAAPAHARRPLRIDARFADQIVVRLPSS